MEDSLNVTLKRGQEDGEGSMRAQLLTTDSRLAIAMQNGSTTGGDTAMGEGEEAWEGDGLSSRCN